MIRMIGSPPQNIASNEVVQMSIWKELTLHFHPKTKQIGKVFEVIVEKGKVDVPLVRRRSMTPLRRTFFGAVSSYLVDLWSDEAEGKRNLGMAPFVSPSSALLITSIYFPAGVKPDEMPENHSPFNLPNWCSLTSLSLLLSKHVATGEKIAAQNFKCWFYLFYRLS